MARCRHVDEKGVRCKEKATPSGAEKFCYKCACKEYGRDQTTGWPKIPEVESNEKFAVLMYLFWLISAAACFIVVLCGALG